MKSHSLIRLLTILLFAGISGCAGNAVPQSTDSPPEEVANTDAAPAEPTGSWEVVFETEPLPHKATAIGFLNENFGITAGYAGEVHYTVDGGISWPLAANSSMCRFGLDILDDKVAWTIGNGGNVRLSKDGGRTWQAVELYLGVSPTAVALSPDFAQDGLLFVGTDDGQVVALDVAALGEE